MASWETLAGYGLTLAGGGYLSTLLTKYLNRKLDEATVEHVTQQAQQVASESVRVEVETLRSVLEELRQNYASKTEQINEYRFELRSIKRRLSLVEERERHMLTRAAVHEAWDQMAFQILLGMDPNHPPPPPLGVPKALADKLNEQIEEKDNGDYESESSESG